MVFQRLALVIFGQARSIRIGGIAPLSMLMGIYELRKPQIDWKKRENLGYRKELGGGPEKVLVSG